MSKQHAVAEIAMSHEDKMAVAAATTTIFPGAYYRAARTLIVKFPAEDRTVELWLDPTKWDPQMMAVLARSLRANRVLAQCSMEVALDWFAMTQGVYALRIQDEITGGIKAGVTVMLEPFDTEDIFVRSLRPGGLIPVWYSRWRRLWLRVRYGAVSSRA